MYQMRVFVFIALSIAVTFEINAQELTPVAPTNSNSTNNLEENETIEEELDFSITNDTKKKTTQTKVKSITQTQKVQQYSKALRIFNQVESASNQHVSQRNPTAEEQQQLETALEEMEETRILGVDYYLSQYKAGNFDMSRLSYLEKARQLDPLNKEVIKQLTGANFILDNQAALNQNILELRKLNIFNRDYYNYAHDVVLGLQPNATLISHGENDTYPLIKELKELNRSDVTLVSLDFLQSETYRNSLIKKGYVLPKGNLVNTYYLSEFCNLNATRNMQIAYSVPKNYLQNIASSLYVSGLTFEYAKNKVNIFRKNLNFYDQVKLGSLLQSNSSLANQLKSNYLPALLALKSGYLNQQNTAKVRELEKLLNQIAEQSNKVKELKSANVK